MNRIFFDPNDTSERVEYGKQGLYNPGSYNISDELVKLIRTGRPTSVTESQQQKLDSPINFKFSAPLVLYLIAGVLVLAVIKSAFGGNFDLSKSLVIVLIAAFCVIGAVLLKGRETSENALADEGKKEAYIHTVADKAYFHAGAGVYNSAEVTYLINVAGEQFSVHKYVYDSLVVGGEVTCVISAKDGMYYIDFLP